ncbi:MAG TPA: hypothetical protein VGN32_13390 [Ktedonobacterales bacterium]|nr:hypothetical protein [Ktedonobacterales bacterium]
MRSIVVDFNTMQMDPQQRVVLGEVGTPNGDRLTSCQPGESVLLDGGDLRVVGTLEYDTQLAVWYAIPAWSTRRDVEVNTGQDVSA